MLREIVSGFRLYNLLCETYRNKKKTNTREKYESMWAHGLEWTHIVHTLLYTSEKVHAFIVD
jgi:Tfp pilus assembly protein PilV